MSVARAYGMVLAAVEAVAPHAIISSTPSPVTAAELLDWIKDLGGPLLPDRISEAEWDDIGLVLGAMLRAHGSRGNRPHDHASRMS